MTPPSRDEARERLAAKIEGLILSALYDAPHKKPPTGSDAPVKVLSDDIAALLSPEQGWRDIESAPMDGRSVLVFCPRASDHGYERIRLTWRKDGKWQGANNTSWPPTHWMPLPPHPQPDE